LRWSSSISYRIIWDTVPHTIKKRIDRTRSCEACHAEGNGFLIKEALIKDGSNANEGLINTPKPIEKQEVV
jgi:hypothetical protein